MYTHSENMWKIGSLLILVISAVTADDHGSTAVSHTAETFASQVEETKHFVMFFAPWCGHCKRLAPTWNELAKLYNEKEEKEVIIAKVDCTTDTALCAENDVTGYPTIKFFPNGKEGAIRYKGVRDLNTLQDFVEEQLGRKPEFAPEDKQAGERPPEGPLYDLNDENFAKFTQTGYHFIKFFAPWCGHCKRLAPTWEDLARLYAEDETVSISKVDCTQSQQLCSSHGVRGYPTLLLFKDGQKVEQYSGHRDLDDFKSYLNKMVEQKDEKVESEEEKVPEKKPDDEALKEGGKPAEGPLYDLNDENFAKFTQTGYHFIKFFAPWCGHCKRLAPMWEDLAKLFADDKAVSISKVDCTQSQQLCTSHGVRGYPTLLLFKDGQKVEEYPGQRDLDAFKSYLNKMVEQKDEKVESEEKEVSEKEPDDEVLPAVFELSSDNFKDAIEEDVTFIKFYAPWCGHCKRLAPTWDDLSKKYAEVDTVKIAKVDCTQHKNICQESKVRGYPTLIIFKNGERLEEYNGSRDLGSLSAFVDKFIFTGEMKEEIRDEL